MKELSNTFCYTVLDAVINSKVVEGITDSLQKQLNQHAKNMAELNFTVDFRLTKFGDDHGVPNFFCWFSAYTYLVPNQAIGGGWGVYLEVSAVKVFSILLEGPVLVLVFMGSVRVNITGLKIK